jgi:hypothetical protein
MKQGPGMYVSTFSKKSFLSLAVNFIITHKTISWYLKGKYHIKAELCTHTHTHTHSHIYMCVCVCNNIWINIFSYVRINVCAYLYVFT